MSKQKFIPFTQQEQLRASSVNLVSFLQSKGEQLERAGHDYKLIYFDETGRHDSITISGNRWYDHKNRVGGGPIKLLREHFGMTYQEAMMELLGCHAAAFEHPTSQPKEQQKKEFKLPDANVQNGCQNMRRVFAYLTKQRFIDPQVVSFFAHERKLYEDKNFHNAVFVGVDENGIPRQAHKRSTITYGKPFRQTVDGSDTRYSFSHFGQNDKLLVFEAPIDMMSFITLNPYKWQESSYIAMNGVYENAVLTALKNHSNISEIIICTDNDEGGIDAADRLKDILNEKGYMNVQRLVPTRKDWNEDLKQLNGMPSLPSVPHQRKACYHCVAALLNYKQFDVRGLLNRISCINPYNYEELASTALSASAIFFTQSKVNANGTEENFELLKKSLMDGYRSYTDKSTTAVKNDNLKKQMRKSINDLRYNHARTVIQMKETGKGLYLLADYALRCQADAMILASQSNVLQEDENTESSDECFREQYLTISM